MQSSPYYSSMVGLGLAEKPKKKKKYKEIKEPNFQIEVTLINAEIHTGFDSDGLADGYVKVKGLNRDSGSGKLFYTGPVGDHSLSPQWNHIKTIKFNPNKYCGLIFDMYDKDPILNSDDFIGRGIFDPSSTVSGMRESCTTNRTIQCFDKNDSKIIYATLYVNLVATEIPLKTKKTKNNAMFLATPDRFV
eukprot:TRINITY_DN2131_c0_g3_i2.p1 TRINITY_DN2131_c0_g3~~TRINITY_DN2131_c0_g3_i2.p1  ORF type:complete len:190 (-),score=32.63 TRINITY_DN2131_c0_g3_i2:187-756(-)